MGCCDSIIRTLLFIFNFVFVVCGIIVLIVGAVLLADAGDFSDVLDEVGSGLKAPQIVLIVLGTIIFIIAFLGCCGALRGNKCMLITYAIFLIIIFIIQLTIGIYAVVNYDSEMVRKGVQNIFDKGMNGDKDAEAVFWGMEKALECCGVSGSGDYSPGSIPAACCPATDCSRGGYYGQGCSEGLREWIEDSAKIIGGVAIGLSIIEIVGAFFAVYQSRKTEVF